MKIFFLFDKIKGKIIMTSKWSFIGCELYLVQPRFFWVKTKRRNKMSELRSDWAHYTMYDLCTLMLTYEIKLNIFITYDLLKRKRCVENNVLCIHFTPRSRVVPIVDCSFFCTKALPHIQIYVCVSTVFYKYGMWSVFIYSITIWSIIKL